MQMEQVKKQQEEAPSKEKVGRQPQLKVLHLAQKRADAERARLMLLSVKLMLGEK